MDDTATADPIDNTTSLAEALRAVMKLITDGDLVRDTSHDLDFTVFVTQATRIIAAVGAANTALETYDRNQ